MGFFGPKCFLSSAFFILSILSVYGVVGSVFNYLQTRQLHNLGEWPSNILPLLVAFIIIRCLFPVVGTFAAVAAYKKSPLFLYGSGSILLAIFTCSMVFGIVSCTISSQQILESYFQTFRRGVNNDSRLLEWMNDIQWQHKCCGIYSYVDWYTADSSLTVNNKIPSSCCRRENRPYDKNCGANKFSDVEMQEKSLYSQGCGWKLANSTREDLQRVGIEMCICGGVSLLVAIFLYVGVTRFFVAGTNSSGNQGGYNHASKTSEQSGGNAACTNDENNNIRNSKNTFIARRERKRLSLEKRIKKGANGKSHSSLRSPFASIHSQAKMERSARSKFGIVSKSKSFIIGDTPSISLKPISEEKDSELLRKNVDMLWYQSVEKNTSTLSTTPNDISSMLISGMGFQIKKTGLGGDAVTTLNDEEAFSQRNTVYTLVSERPFTASLSQNCSQSFVNNNNGTKPQLSTEPETLSPTNSTSKQQRQPTKTSNDILEERQSELLKTKTAELPSTSNELIRETKNREPLITEDDSGSDNDEDLSLAQQANNMPINANPSQLNSKYPNPTSSVRSSTLATIDEESESSKGSPNNTKGFSPASGSLTPETLSPKQTVSELHPSIENKDDKITRMMNINCTNNNGNDFNLGNVDLAPTEPSI